ncbi:MAG: metal-dependent hydrolase [Deltaproteobacteria bacterium]|nr:metal-dependent hydrolase [Deltaproteobacteria bacterium]
MPEAASHQPIVVRQMDFEFPTDLDPVVVDGDPEQSYLMIGLSLLLPYLEPYLIRTMKVAKKQVSDPQLIDDLERFSAQEGQHYRQHIRFNESLRLEGFEKLAELEATLDADYKRFSKTRSLRFNLAYAEGFEALTTASARFSFERGPDPNLHPSARALFQWHLVEELEHRTVAFDVYNDVCGGYPYRLVAGLYAQWHMARFIARVTSYMIEADPAAVERCGGKAGRRARQRSTLRDLRKLFLPKLLKTYLPNYTPHDIPFDAELQEMAAELNVLARSTR